VRECREKLRLADEALEHGGVVVVEQLDGNQGVGLAITGAVDGSDGAARGFFDQVEPAG
jgi:hypothetical protein